MKLLTQEKIPKLFVYEETIDEMLDNFEKIITAGCPLCSYKPKTIEDLVWHSKSHFVESIETRKTLF